MTLSQDEREFETVRITAYTYAVVYVTLVPAHALATSQAPLGVPEAIGMAICCPAFALAALSAARRKRIGYYFCLCVSVMLLFSIGLGTVLGWNMLRALRRNRERFWPERARFRSSPLA